MKKTAMIALAILLAATSVNAQNGYDSKHEVAFGYGMFSNSQIFDALSTYVATEAGVTFSNAKYNGSLAVEYLHRVNNWFGYGGEFVYRSSSMDFSTIEGVQKEGTSTSNYFTLMPTVKFDWLRTKYFGLYSKIALGISMYSWQNVYLDGRDTQSNSTLMLNFQASVLGIEAGLPNLRVYLEGGMGEQGTAVFGLRYKF